MVLTLKDVQRHVKDRALAAEAFVTLMQLQEQGRVNVYQIPGWGMLHPERRIFNVYDDSLGVRVSLKYWLEQWLNERQQSDQTPREGGDA
jgi:hypothetical protein